MKTLRLTVCCLLVLPLVIPATAQAEIPDTTLARAATAYAEGDYRRAIALLTPWTHSDTVGRGLFTLGASYAALNELQEALVYLNRAVALNPAHAGFRLQLARTLTAAGKTDAAIKEYTSVLEQDPRSVPGLQGLGLLTLERREFTAAAGYFRRVLGLNPRDYIAAFSLGQILVQIGETDSAVTYLATSLTLQPAFAPCLDLLGSIYYEHGKNRDALRLYRRAILHHPWNPEFWYKQGLCLERLADNAGAVESFSRAVRLDSTHSSAYAHLGQAYYHRGFHDSSASAYRRAAELDPDNPVLFLNEGLALTRIGKVKEAEAAFRLAIRLYEPGSIGNVYMHLGALYYNAERYRDARLAYSRAVQFDPANSEAQFFLALACDRSGNIQAAVTEYRRYLRLVGNDPLQKKRAETARERLTTLRSH